MAIDGEDANAGTGGGAADLLGAGAAPAGGGDGGAGDQGGGDGGFSDGGGDQGGDPAFYELLSAEGGDAANPSNRDWAKSAGVKDPDQAIKMLRDNMKAARAEGKFTVPGADAKPEDIAAFRTAIGVPDKPDGYEIKGPEGVPLNAPLIAKLAESAVKHGAPKGAFEGLVSDFIAAQLDEAATAAEALDDEAAAWVKEQGAGSTAKLAAVDTAARALGLSRDDMTGLRQALGPKRALDLLAKLGDGMAEDTLITGGKGRFGVTGAEAQAEIDRLKTDPEFQKKVMVKGSPESERWNRLNNAAAEGKAKAANAF